MHPLISQKRTSNAHKIMKISLGSDHGGKHLRSALARYLKNQGHQITDHGTYEEGSVDYPDFATAVAKDVASGKSEIGVCVCTTGIGVSISANKIKSVRAALVQNQDAARFSRSHNNANVICFGEKYDTPYLAIKMLDTFLSTKFEGGRHQRRIDKIFAEEQSD